MDKALKQFYQQEFLDYFANPFEDFRLFENLKKVASTGVIPAGSGILKCTQD
jgi:hypothetical protein